MTNDGLSDFSDQYQGQDFIERDKQPAFSGGFGDFGDLPEDLRGMGSVSRPDTPHGADSDVYSPPYTTGYTTDGMIIDPYRGMLRPVPGSYSNQFNFSAINYLPRANFESFRSQRFFAGGSALLPSDPTTFVDLTVDTAALPPLSPVSFSSGVLTVPVGYAAVITGLRQWIGDANAFQKADGTPDDIVWRITAGGAPIFNFGNFPVVISSLDNEAKLFAIATENTTITISVKNSTSGNAERDIAVKGALTGHWFPMDEINDSFRNR